jgi:signal peptidase I
MPFMVKTGIHTGYQTEIGVSRESVGQVRRAWVRRRDFLALFLWLPLALLLWGNLKCAVVQGHSMQPTFHTGQRLFVWTGVPASALRAGDVVVFRGSDGVEMIKRIALIHHGSLLNVRSVYYTHDQYHTPEALAVLFAPYLIARDSGQYGPPRSDQDIYVVGDNFEDSYDSRDYGPISPRQILGKVLF